MASSISAVVSKADKLPPSGLSKITEIVHCPLLPSLDGEGWGRDCTIKKLNVQEQIQLLGRTQDGIAADRKRRLEKDPDAPATDEESSHFWESVHLLNLGCADPIFTIEEATRWITLDEENGVPCADVVQFFLVRIRGFNGEAPGLEDVAGGLEILRKMPRALQAIEQAWEKGDHALDLLLEGRVLGSQDEMAQFIERWGDIISHVVLRSIRKRARVEAEESSEILIGKVVDLLLEMGVAKRKQDGPESEDNESSESGISESGTAE
jgi:hypothetical protein